MARNHVIIPGDHVVRLAYVYGHATIDAMWQHPENAELRQVRPDPGVLAPTDVVHVPDAPARVFDGLLTRREHTLMVELPLPTLRLVLLRPGGIPYAAHACTADFDDARTRSVADSEGTVTLELGPFTNAVALAFDRHAVELAIAQLQPVEATAGWHARLENLGYQPGPLHGDTPADAYAVRSAIEELQCDHGLTVDGVMGPKTRAALLAAHGA
jgi:hypothetical protein